MELLQEEALATIGEAHAETVCGVAELSLRNDAKH